MKNTLQGLLKPAFIRDTIPQHNLIPESKSYFMKYILSFIFLVISFSNIYGQSIMWTDIRGDDYDDIGRQCFQTKDGGFIVISFNRYNNSTVYTYILKYNFNGSLIWEKVLGLNEFSNTAYMVVEDKFGNFYMPVNQYIDKLYKFDHEFNILWSKSLPENVNIGGIAFTPDSNFLLIKSYIYDSTSFFYKHGFTKVDTSGNLIWSKGYNDSLNFNSDYKSFIIDSFGYYIFGRQSNIQNQPKIIKLDTSGNLIWSKVFINNFYNTFYHGTKTGDNKYILIGIAFTPNKSHAFTMKIDSAGNVIWDKMYSQDSIIYGFSICKTYNNNYAIVGGGYYGKCYILTIDSIGNSINLKNHVYQPMNLIAYHWISPASDSGFILTGWFQLDDPAEYCDVLTVKTDKYGNYIPIGIKNKQEQVPYEFEVSVYPNPFNSKFSINIRSFKNEQLQFNMYNISGKQILKFNKNISQGNNTFDIELSKYNISSGIYFLKLSNKMYSVINKLIYLK